jgi:hypothetical protein
MNKFVIAVCLLCGWFYALVGVLLFCTPSLFFYRVAPIGLYNEHYAMDLGSFILPLRVFLIWAAWSRRWAQPVLMIAALGSALHLTSHLRYGGHSQKSVAADISFALNVGLVLAALYATGRPSFAGNAELTSSKENGQC